MPSLRDEIGDFVGIPNSFIEDKKQTAGSRVVFMLLRYHTHRKRKRAFPGFETLMREAGLSRQKTAAAIKVLVESGWLVKHKRFADTTEYELRFPDTSCSSTMELRQETPLVPLRNDVSSTMEQPPLNINTKTEFTKIDKTSRPKRSHKPAEPEIEIDTPYHSNDFIEGLGQYKQVRREMGCPLTKTMIDELYAKLAKYPEADCVIALHDAAAHGYKGVYPEKLNGNGNGHNPQPVQRVQTIRERMGIR